VVSRERRRQDGADAAYRDVFTAVPRDLDGLASPAGRTTK
jgi:hypothetical protein